MKSKILLGMLGGLLAGSVSLAQAPAPTAEPVVYYEEASATGGRFWGRIEYQLWSIRDTPLPVPLVTISGLAGEGILGPGTAVVIGDEPLDLGLRSGARLTVGGWRDASQTTGWEGNYFFYGSHAVDRSASLPAAGLTLLAVPFINANTGAEDATFLSTPEPLGEGGDTFKGDAFLSITSRMQGAELNGVFAGYAGDSFRLRLLAGFRWLQLTEKLVFATSSPDSPSDTPDPVFITEDKFDAHNNFYSGQFGARAEYDLGRLTLAGTLKLALGWMDQQVTVNGLTTTNDFTGSTGPTTTFVGGYFALPTNIGRDNRCQFAFAPEVDVQLGYRLTAALRATVAYSFLYVSSVARPGEQIDRVINPTQAVGIEFEPGVGLTGPARPRLNIQGTDFWAHSLSFGLEYSY
jgi:hypothetical protein